MAGSVTERWIEDRLVRLAGPRGLCHHVVAFQDQALGAELTEVLRLLLASPECVEGVHHVLDLIPLKVVEVKVRCVEFGPDQSSTLFFPPERRSVISVIPRESLHVP